MEKTYVIQWKSKTNGRTGTGTTLFEREKAEQLADELNRDYPEIEHQPLEAHGTLHADAPHTRPGDHHVTESIAPRVMD